MQADRAATTQTMKQCLRQLISLGAKVEMREAYQELEGYVLPETSKEP